MSYYQFNHNPFLRSYNDDESDNNSLFHSYNNYDNNIFEPIDAKKHDDLIDPKSFSYNNISFNLTLSMYFIFLFKLLKGGALGYHNSKI